MIRTPPTTTIAGRHAADQRRTREALQLAERELLQDVAREALAKAFASRGLVTHAHLDPDKGDDRSIFVACRVDTCAYDHELVYAVLDELGWRTDHTRLSRINAHYDVLRLDHVDTGAKVALIVKLPRGRVYQWDAA